MRVQQATRQHRPEGERVGVYICHCGGNISDHVDVESLCERVRKTPGVALARSNLFMCSNAGQDSIIQDLKEGKVDRVVVASCAPSLHESTFRGAIRRAGGNPYLYEHANIREQVSWVHQGPQATDKALRLVAAAAAKARQLEPLEPIRMEAARHVTVIGAGMAGLQAALDLARRGIPVALVEKTPFVGGFLARLDRLFPTGEKAAELLVRLAREVLNHPDITVYPYSQVVGWEGSVGNFKLRLRTEFTAASVPAEVVDSLGRLRRGELLAGRGIAVEPPPAQVREQSMETGAVVFATGFKPYEPRLGEYGYGEFSTVITLPEAIRDLAEANGTEPVWTWNGRQIHHLALIHCVGSRQVPGVHDTAEGETLHEYCSRTCCSATLNLANQVRERYPGTHVFEFYRDIRTYGRGQEELYTTASENRVRFFRFDAEAPPRVAANPLEEDSPLLITVRDTLTFGEEVQVPADLVVLAVGMESNGIEDLVSMMKLPVGEDGFLLEVHPKLRPVELPKAGLLLAGTCQAPMDAGETANAASAAAVKAAALLAKGFVELDPFVAEVDPQRCQGTGACVEACLGDAALQPVEVEIGGRSVQQARVTPAFCLGCGACVAVCAEQAIHVKGWTLQQYEAMVDALVADAAA